MTELEEEQHRLYLAAGLSNNLGLIKRTMNLLELRANDMVTPRAAVFGMEHLHWALMNMEFAESFSTPEEAGRYVEEQLRRLE